MSTIEGLGGYGVYTFDFEHQPAGQIRDSARELEELGWRAFWFPEVGGREAFSLAGFLLDNTEELHVVNGIAQITARSARATHGAATLLGETHGDRHVLGLGLGQGRPGVYGPKMLALARDRAAGAHTYHVTTGHTAQAREILGPDTFLGVEHAVLFETDPDKARAVAREHMHVYLTTPFNVAKFRRLGYTEEEIGAGGSDRIIDDLVFWGDVDTIVAKLQAHVDAGADHVAIQVIGVEPGRSAMPWWRRLGEALR